LNIAYLVLGSNLGDRQRHLSTARKKIEESGIDIIKTSAIYETEPWGVTDHPNYLNQAIAIQTTRYPFGLLKKLQQIEHAMGRNTKGDYAPREIDIDIIYFNDWIIETAELIIPHPRLPLRKFVLVPVREIAGDLTDPVSKNTLSELIRQCNDDTKIHILDKA